MIGVLSTPIQTQIILYNKAGTSDQDMLCAELSDFVGAVISGRDPQVTLNDGAAALRVAAEIERIGNSGTIV